jgi:hypothetical protein
LASTTKPETAEPPIMTMPRDRKIISLMDFLELVGMTFLSQNHFLNQISLFDI